ncbi:MAG: hypothetical protein LBQ81_09750 [Zoogloeaceae bacterium]|jgi:hypothetical protein|nr:hypothetical protein [Zoogloeaceae bacterium]
MAAATNRILTPSRAGEQFSDPAAAGVVIHEGTLVALSAAGYAVPATAAGGTVRGVAERSVDNTDGAAGDVPVPTCLGVFSFLAAGFTRADIGSLVYVVDNQTVAKTGAALAGVVVDVDGDYRVWVDIRPAAAVAATLAAAA